MVPDKPLPGIESARDRNPVSGRFTFRKRVTMNKLQTILKWAATVLTVVMAVEQNAPIGSGDQKLSLALGILQPAADEAVHVTGLIADTVAALNGAGLFRHADTPPATPAAPTPTAAVPLGRAVQLAKMAQQRDRNQDAAMDTVSPVTAGAV